MQEIMNDKDRIILRFDLGEEAIAGLVKYCQENRIKAGWINMLGACGFVKLSYYNLDTKVYEDRDISQNLEVLAVTGNVATLNHKTIIHVHGSFSDQDFKVVGGHIKELKVSATLEVYMQKFSEEILRKPDAFTGLNLMS